MKTNLQTKTTICIENNDPLRQFIDEIVPELQWDLVPYSFLYDLYKVWYNKNNPSGSPSSKLTFHKEFKKLMKDNPDWNIAEYGTRYRPVGKITKPEPLIAEYKLYNWMNPRYLSSYDMKKRCIPELKGQYLGMVRV